tara:strand:+ start:630 stop:2672 length:2043 start_codon:yes stop_codon:yes gene_type:complete
MEIDKKTILIIQARLTSKRFPHKVLKKIGNEIILDKIYHNVSKTKKVNQVVVSIPNNLKNIDLKNYLRKKNFKYFCGSENDVLKRFFMTAKEFKADTVVRITADCPLIDYKIIDKMLDIYHNSNLDLISNTITPTFPDGLDVEIFNFKLLKKSHFLAKSNFDREHVTPFMYRNVNLKKKNYFNNINYSNVRLTVDEKNDLKNINQIIKKIKTKNFDWKNIIKILNKDKKLMKKFTNIPIRGLEELDSGPKLWKEALKLIPGGNMLKSKNPDLFLPNKWPTYFSKTSGCYVWDLDNKKYIDMSLMGVGTNILGYSNKKVDDAVSKVIKKGNISTLNCPEEVQLAKKLINLHQWADMAKFCRSGGEANAVAVRIARAFNGKEKVAVCGYHGWHDWYLASNLNNKKNLDSHLYQNLKIKGVPKSLRSSSFTFNFNSLKEIKKIISKNNLAAIVMEVSRNYKPNLSFLKEIRNLTKKNNIVLIFDECTSGFRETNGGLHKKYKVNPDIAVFGKALGNGYAITSVIGKKDIMKSTNETFISSTFWSERIGFVAALKTLEVMENKKSWEVITRIGYKIRSQWKKIASKNNLKIKIYGLPSLSRFEIQSKNWVKYKTYITQEMLKYGFLASDTIYVSIVHSDKILKKYLSKLDIIFNQINQCEKNHQNIDYLIHNDISKLNMIKRMN